MKFQLRRDAPALALLALMFAGAAYTWPRAPDRIPVHWDLHGAVDGWGGRAEGLLLLPAVALGVWGLLMVLPRLDPGRENYRNFAGPYGVLRTAIVAFLALVHLGGLSAALGRPIPIGSLIGPATGLLFVVLGGLMGKLRPNWFVGIRTPWTLSSKRSWIRTHRVGGWAFIACGVATLIAGLFAPEAAFVVMLGGIAGCVIGTTVYSYVVWKGDPDRQMPGGTTPTG